MMFHDGTDQDYVYGYPYCKHSTGTGSEHILVPCKTLVHTHTCLCSLSSTNWWLIFLQAEGLGTGAEHLAYTFLQSTASFAL